MSTNTSFASKGVSGAVFFYGHSKGKRYAEFSNFYPSVFVIGDQKYGYAEQYIMAEKARIFGDHKQLAAILTATNPGAMKSAGRKVKGFNEKEWQMKRKDVAFHALKAKFEQNPHLAQVLMATGDAMIYEAAENDKEWGIGMSAEEALKVDPTTWINIFGFNLLGKTLVNVRHHLQSRATGAGVGGENKSRNDAGIEKVDVKVDVKSGTGSGTGTSPEIQRQNKSGIGAGSSAEIQRQNKSEIQRQNKSGIGAGAGAGSGASSGQSHDDKYPNDPLYVIQHPPTNKTRVQSFLKRLRGNGVEVNDEPFGLDGRMIIASLSYTGGDFKQCRGLLLNDCTALWFERDEEGNESGFARIDRDGRGPGNIDHSKKSTTGAAGAGATHSQNKH